MTDLVRITMPYSAPLYDQLGIVEAIKADNLVFLSGQAGMNERFEPLPTFEQQCHATFTNMKNVLAEAGGTDADIVQIIAYLVDVPSAEEFSGRVMTAFQYFREILPQCRTTSTAIGVPKLVVPGMMLEVQALAIVGA
jgi:enamine deaminase RidA (YjgF/YER057c/UK114 family)